MTDRSHFPVMMHVTHVAAAIFKFLFSYVGFVTFGLDTQEVITNNLPNKALRVIVNLFLVAKCLLSYPLPYFASAELLEKAFFRGRPDTFFPSCYGERSTDDGRPRLKLWAVALRVALVAVTMLMAIFVPHFSLLMGLIGNITGNMLSLVWPAYFHLRIKGGSLGLIRRSADIIIVLFGLIYCCIAVYYSAGRLIRAFYHGQASTKIVQFFPFDNHTLAEPELPN